MALTIADISVDVERSADWLVNGYDDPNSYEGPLIVKYYDCGGQSLRTELGLADIGRMVVLAARLKANEAMYFLERGKDAPWPSTSTQGFRLDDEPDLSDEEFAKSDSFKIAQQLFDYFNGERSAMAQTSKLLHLKWPAFFPIVDSECRKIYGEKALHLHNSYFSQPGRSRLRSPNSENISVASYWLAFRKDLLANHGDLNRLKQIIRATIPSLTCGHDQDHALRLASLESLRLLDMLTWGLGNGRANEIRVP